MQKRRFLTAVFALLAAAALCGCGAKEAAAPQPTAIAATPEPTPEPTPQPTPDPLSVEMSCFFNEGLAPVAGTAGDKLIVMAKLADRLSEYSDRVLPPEYAARTREEVSGVVWLNPEPERVGKYDNGTIAFRHHFWVTLYDPFSNEWLTNGVRISGGDPPRVSSDLLHDTYGSFPAEEITAFIRENWEAYLATPESTLPQYTCTVENGEAAIVEYKGNLEITELTLPDVYASFPITRISAARMFWRCAELKRVIIPNGIREIGDYAFYNLRKLEQVEIPASVREIGDSAFGGCDALTIRGPAGSFAERYAKAEGIAFEKN